MLASNLVSKLCNDNIQCEQHMCQQEHQRIYAGICIKQLKILFDDQNQDTDIEVINYQQCDGNCGLQHFSKKEWQIMFRGETINGVYWFNLCKTQCQNQNCRYLHRKWAEDICIDELEDECSQDKQCKKKHILWTELRQVVYNKCNKGQFNPENLCIKENCSCQNHLEYLNQFCIQYIIGKCPKLKCLKIHADWEDITFSVIHYNNALQPCKEVDFGSNSFYNFKSKLQNHQLKVYCDEEKLKVFKKTIHESNIIDVIFIMDLTGSMIAWKQEMEITLAKVIQEFRTVVKGSRLRVGFVGYRDIKDEEQIVYRNLTEKVEEITQFIIKQQVKGGDDTAEDIISGLEQALKLNISRHEKSVLCTFLIADAPNHGKQYHNMEISHDKYYNLIQQNILENIMKQFEQMKQNSFFTCIKITDLTNKMFSIMEQNFKNIIITEKSQPEGLTNLVKLSLNQTLSQIKLNNNQSSTILIESSYQKWKIIDHNYPQNYNRQQYWKDFKQHIDQFNRQGQTCLEINKDPETYVGVEQGQHCVVFKAFDALNNRYVLIKLLKNIYEEYSKTQQLTQESQEFSIKFAKQRYYQTAYANQMAYLYRKVTKKIQTAPPIFYVSPILYKLNESFYGVNEIYGESFIDLPNYQWQKFSNDGTFIDGQYYYFSAFSHFTYNESGGLFVITDLQGKGLIFTDPQIYQVGDLDFLTNLDLLNQKQNLLNFTNCQHKQCSELCKLLNLNRELFDNKNLDYDKQMWKPDNNQHIYIICQTCDEFRDYSIQEYRQSNMNQCTYCKELDKEPQYQLCKCCNYQYQYHPNIDLVTLTLYAICDHCKQNCKDEINKCQYCNIFCLKRLRKIENIFVCEQGYEYLSSLNCKKCKKVYDFKQILNKIDYLNNNYICDICK